MLHLKSLQHGQALIETIIIGLIFVLLMFAIQSSGYLRLRSLELLGDSSYLSFIKSETVYKESFKEKRPSIQQENILKTVSAQLLHTSEESVIRIQQIGRSHADKRLMFHKLLNIQPLQRSSYLFIQDGHSASGRAVQQRIGQSNAVWKEVAHASVSVLKPLVPPLKKIDMPWRRPTLRTDWLSHWSEQSPTPSQFQVPPQ